MHFLSRAYINIIYVDALVVLCEEGNSENFHFPCVRPHIELFLCQCTFFPQKKKKTRFCFVI